MRKLLAISIFLGLPLMAAQAQAGTCSDAIKAAQRKIFGNLGKVCNGVDTSAKTNSPFVYVNPDGDCDIGLDIPGLPRFGAKGGNGFDMCGLAKTITGGMVNKANGVIREKMNTTINGINQATQETIGTGVVNQEVNISDIINQKTQQAVQNQGYVP